MKNLTIEIKWALIYTLMSITWALLGKLFGFYTEHIAYNPLFNTLIILPSVIVYTLAIREKKLRFYNGQMTYRQGMISGLFLTLFVTILGPVYPWFTQLISPDLFERSIAFAVSSGAMTADEASRQLNLKTFIVQGFLAGPVFGTIYTAIIAAFLRSRHHGFVKNQG